MTRRKILCFTGITLAALMAGAPAQATTIVLDPTDTDVIPGVAGFMTTGNLMAGMEVSVAFSDGFMDTQTWAVTGPTSGGVSGDGYSLEVDGDTFVSDWMFMNSRMDVGGSDVGLTSLTLDGRPGLTLFDLTFNNTFGTDGSFLGRDFAESPTTDGTATYSRIVALTGDAAVGDLWHVLSVEFDDQGIEGDWSFVQDSDNDIRRPPPQVPEPTTAFLLGIGSIGIAWLRRRRK